MNTIVIINKISLSRKNEKNFPRSEYIAFSLIPNTAYQYYAFRLGTKFQILRNNSHIGILYKYAIGTKVVKKSVSMLFGIPSKFEYLVTL